MIHHGIISSLSSLGLLFPSRPCDEKMMMGSTFRDAGLGGKTAGFGARSCRKIVREGVVRFPVRFSMLWRTSCTQQEWCGLALFFHFFSYSPLSSGHPPPYDKFLLLRWFLKLAGNEHSPSWEDAVGRKTL